MKEVIVKVKNLSKSLPLPKYSTDGADGMDVMACFDAIDDKAGEPIYPIRFHEGSKTVLEVNKDGQLTIYPGDRVMISTGLKVGIPEGWRIHVTPRSGLALKNGITVLNSPGKIDQDYLGQIGVILINHGTESFIVKHGDRIAQIAIEESHKCKFMEVEELTATTRGEGGFGSTGVN